MCDKCSRGSKRPLSKDKEMADDIFPYRITIPLYEALMKDSFTPSYKPEESIDGKMKKFTIKKEE